MLMWRRKKMMRLRGRMLRRKTDPKTGRHTVCEPAQATCAWTFHKSHFVWKCTRKMAADTSAARVLCEPAQSKCAWTFHKSHFVRKFTGKMPDAPDTTSFEHRALTVTVRTPQSCHTVWGKHVDCHEEVWSNMLKNGKRVDYKTTRILVEHP